mgnify:FL=1
MSNTTTEEIILEKPESKNFKNNTDVENFYRFVYENSLRFEARKILEHVLIKKKKKRKRTRKAKSLQ